MAKQEKKSLNVADKAGVIDTFWSLAERIKTIKAVTWLFGACSAMGFALWSYLESNLPYWAIAFVFIIALIIMLALTYAAAKAFTAIKVARSSNPIDNTELTNELNEIGSRLLEISIANDAEYQQARLDDIREGVRVSRETGTDNNFNDQIEQNKVRIKLGDIYSNRYAGRVHGLIAQSIAVLGEEAVERRYWHVRNRSYNDPHSMNDLGRFLIDLSVAIKHDVPIPDRW